MSSTYFNTINLTGEALKEKNRLTASQNDLIKALFQDNPGRHIGPTEVVEIARIHWGRNWPLTSIRRAMSYLASPKYDEVLAKTTKMVTGSYGDDEHTWILKSSASPLEIIAYKKGESSASDHAKNILELSKSEEDTKK